MSWPPRTRLLKVRRNQAVGRLHRCCQKEQAGKAHRCRWSPSLLRLAGPKGMHIGEPPRATQMLRMWKSRTWGPNLPSREGLKPFPCTAAMLGLQSSHATDCLLRTNGAYRATCRFWVRSRIKTSVRGCTSISRARLKTNVSGMDSIETRRSYMRWLDTEVNRIQTRCWSEDVIELVLHRKSSLPIQAR